MTLLDDKTVAPQAKWELSARLATLAAVSLAAGIAFGEWLYGHRSTVRQHYREGTAAWPAHLVLAALTLVAALLLVRRKGFAGAVRWLTAPISARAMDRVRRTARGGGFLRLVLALPPAVLLLYLPFRMGMQVLAGRDPNFTVDAWGGPTYAGAMACHYLDAVPLTLAASWLLDRLLLPAEQHGPSKR